MKKLALALLAAFALAVPAKSQNNRQGIYLDAKGLPAVTINTNPGTVYDQMFSAIPGALFPSALNLGYGTSSCAPFQYGSCTAGTAVLAEGPLDNGTTPTGALAQVLGVVAVPSAQVGTVNNGAFGLYASSSIVVSNSYLVLLSSGGNITLTSTPNISTLTVSGASYPDGAFVSITSTATQVITLQSNGALSGSLIKLGATSRAITQFKTLTLRFNKALGMWLEESYVSAAN